MSLWLQWTSSFDTNRFNGCEFSHQCVEKRFPPGWRDEPQPSDGRISNVYFQSVSNVHILKDNLVTHIKRLHTFFLLASWPKTEQQRNKAAPAHDSVDKYSSEALPIISAFRKKICLRSFIVTNYSGMEDSAPQLRLTGNFREGLKIWITSSTLCLGLNSKIQTWIKLLPTFTLMYLYLFGLS